MATLEFRDPTRLRLDLPVISAGIVGWLLLNLLLLRLANGILPFDRPAMAGAPFALQVAMPTLGLIEQLVLMGLVWRMTRRRTDFDMAARAPDTSRAWRETLGLIAYAMVGQVGGWIVGPALGLRPFSFHLAVRWSAAPRRRRREKRCSGRATISSSSPSCPTSGFGGSIRTLS